MAGTQTGYRKDRCRCADCRAWNSQSRKRERAVAQKRESADESLYLTLTKSLPDEPLTASVSEPVCETVSPVQLPQNVPLAMPRNVQASVAPTAPPRETSSGDAPGSAPVWG